MLLTSASCVCSRARAASSPPGPGSGPDQRGMSQSNPPALNLVTVDSLEDTSQGLAVGQDLGVHHDCPVDASKSQGHQLLDRHCRRWDNLCWMFFNLGVEPGRPETNVWTWDKSFNDMNAIIPDGTTAKYKRSDRRTKIAVDCVHLLLGRGDSDGLIVARWRPVGDEAVDDRFV
jgi:hypothetical protein